MLGVLKGAPVRILRRRGRGSRCAQLAVTTIGEPVPVPVPVPTGESHTVRRIRHGDCERRQGPGRGLDCRGGADNRCWLPLEAQQLHLAIVQQACSLAQQVRALSEVQWPSIHSRRRDVPKQRSVQDVTWMPSAVLLLLPVAPAAALIATQRLVQNQVMYPMGRAYKDEAAAAIEIG